MKRRTFNGQADLDDMQLIVKGRTRVMGPCTNLHPGDVAHRIYSGSRMYALDDVIPVWVDETGMVSFGIVAPKDQWFDVVTRIGINESDRSSIIREIVRIATNDGRVETDVIGNDTSLISELSDMGFKPKPAEYVFTQQHLVVAAIAPSHGFTVRSVSIDDAEQLAAVHSGAFGSSWTPDGYATRMRQPGYDAADELVAVNRDGTFMGFTNTWYDDVNLVGYFEPVGVHRDFHRRGVGTVLLQEGMRLMHNAGMKTATVWHARTEERAVQFYRSNGFEVCSIVTPWVRSTSRGAIPLIA